jgi:hypothetical protein
MVEKTVSYLNIISKRGGLSMECNESEVCEEEVMQEEVMQEDVQEEESTTYSSEDLLKSFEKAKIDIGGLLMGYLQEEKVG